VPDSAEEAGELAELGALAPTHRITVERKPGEQFDRIVRHELGLKPPRLDSEEGLPDYAAAAEDDSVPF